MYASTTDYGAVYDEIYHRRGPDPSFNVGILPALLGAFCRQAGASALLDVSGGQGRLAGALRDLGIQVLTTDIGGTSERGMIPFDLSRYNDADVARVRERADRVAGHAPHVTSCLDVLEHIDREHISAAVRNFARLTARFLIVSISTRPSSRDNLYHATIFPIQTWIRAFEAGGFHVRKTSPFTPAIRQLAPEQYATEPLIDRWRTTDLFADIAGGEPRYLVFEKVIDVQDWAAAESEIGTLFDVAYYKEKRRQFSAPSHARFLVSLHHVQEFALLRPLLDVFGRKSLQVLLRRQFMDGVYLRAIGGFLARNGVRTHVYDRAEELPWSEFTDRTLITAADSTCAVNHVFGFQISSLARLHGCKTYLLQHGIWPNAFYNRIVAFGAEHVLNWGNAEERILQESQHRIGAVDVPWGSFSPRQVRRIGSPRYTDQLLPIHPDGLSLRLGVNRAKFSSVVLLGTQKLDGRWAAGGIDDPLRLAMCRLIDACPETLFLVRPHPARGLDDLGEWRRENVRILDEACCIMADLPLSRILPLVDQVITPMSTLALDGAISGKPAIICEGRQPAMYQHLEPAPAEQLPTLLRSADFLAEAARRTTLFKNTYAEAVDGSFYQRFSEMLCEPMEPDAKPSATLAIAVSLSAEAESQWFAARQAETNAAEHITKLESELATLRQETAVFAHNIDIMRKDLEDARQHLAEMNQSTSWRLTAPLRWVAALVRSQPGT